MKVHTLNISQIQRKSFIENLPLNSFLHVFLLLPLPAVTRPLCALVGHPQLDLVVEPAGGEHGEGGVGLQHVHHAVVVAGHQLDDPLGLAVPEEDVPAVRAGDDKLALRAVEVDALHRGVVPVALVPEGGG